MLEEADPLKVASFLRSEFGPDLGRRAAELVELRRKALRRFPNARLPWLTRKGLEQATSQYVAEARARRFAAQLPGAWLLDATCGIGSDSVALARAGVRVVSADLDPLHLNYARANLEHSGCEPRMLRADARLPVAQTAALLLDPDRRATGKRSLDPESWSPPLARGIELGLAHRAACLKLAPAMDPEDAHLPPGARFSWQWVSSRGELSELNLWLGETAAAPAGDPELRGMREILLIDTRGGTWSWSADPRAVEALEPAEAHHVAFLADPDPAVIRSGLLEALAHEQGMRPLARQIAYLGGAVPPNSKALQGWRVLGSTPLDPRRVRELLREHDIGPLTVKKRGHPDSAEKLRARFKGPGSRPGTLLVSRLESGHYAYLVERYRD